MPPRFLGRCMASFSGLSGNGTAFMMPPLPLPAASTAKTRHARHVPQTFPALDHQDPVRPPDPQLRRLGHRRCDPSACRQPARHHRGHDGGSGPRRGGRLPSSGRPPHHHEPGQDHPGTGPRDGHPRHHHSADRRPRPAGPGGRAPETGGGRGHPARGDRRRSGLPEQPAPVRQNPVRNRAGTGRSVRARLPGRRARLDPAQQPVRRRRRRRGGAGQRRGSPVPLCVRKAGGGNHHLQPQRHARPAPPTSPPTSTPRIRISSAATSCARTSFTSRPSAACSW